MNTLSRHVGFSVCAGAALLGSLGLASCSTDDADPPGTGGSGGTMTSGGATSGGSAGSSSGGSSGGTTGGSGGATGGSGGAPVTCTPQPAPAGGLMLDEGVADMTRPGFYSFGDFSMTFSGGNFIYPEMGMYPLTSTWTAGGVWNIAGTVGDYSGFGLYFPCRADLSAFDGIEFTISGTLGMAPLTMRFGMVSNTYDAPTAMPPLQGTCVPASTTNPGATCTEPKIAIEVTDQPVTHQITWAEFTDGLPNDMANPAEFMNFSWYFAWPATAPYEVDITIDNVTFMGGPPGTGGAGRRGGFRRYGGYRRLRCMGGHDRRRRLGRRSLKSPRALPCAPGAQGAGQ
jgi:hypothetical protein